jgi:hypothetical protein
VLVPVSIMNLFRGRLERGHFNFIYLHITK